MRAQAGLSRPKTHVLGADMAGVPSQGRWIGPLVRPVRMALTGPFVSQTMTFFPARQNAEDLSVLSGFLEAGTVVPVIDRTYPLAEAALRPGGGPGQATHTVLLRAVEEVDDEVRHLLRAAYEQNA
jgi:NADPH:quinone reductase-like Zn-dependent oxidoreductase